MMIVGIDEAGRGCWAGPLVAAAVRLNFTLPAFDDSKKLTKAKREQLSEFIKRYCNYGIGWVSAKEVDDIGLTAATQKAMSQALSEIDEDYDEIVIDGNFNYLAGQLNVRVLPKADSLVPAVSAASIIAKTARDQYMYDIASRYPAYQFEKHVGYGTALHYEMIKLHGPCELHRLSYKPLQVLLKIKNV